MTGERGGEVAVSLTPQHHEEDALGGPGEFSEKSGWNPAGSTGTIKYKPRLWVSAVSRI